jgi:hypothetical protein
MDSARPEENPGGSPNKAQRQIPLDAVKNIGRAQSAPPKEPGTSDRQCETRWAFERRPSRQNWPILYPKSGVSCGVSFG